MKWIVNRNISAIKISIVILFLASLVCKVGYSQSNNLKFGIKAGLNFTLINASVLPTPVDHLKNDNGFFAGIQYRIKLDDRFSLQPEVFYIESRVQINTVSGGSQGYESTDEIKNLNVPLLGKVNFGHFGIFVGPQIAFLLKANRKYQDINAPTPGEQTADVTDNSYRKTQFSAVAGLEYTFRYRFGIDLRYQQGLSNVSASNGTTTITSDPKQNIKLSGFQTGIYFKFGRKPVRNK